MSEFLTTLTEHGVLLTNVILIGVSAWLAHVTAVVARHDAQTMSKMSHDNNRTILSIVRTLVGRGKRSRDDSERS